MSQDQHESENGPYWLTAYPNKGMLDYFGFRFLRQAKRRHLFVGGASSNFSTAKTLLLFPALALEFRSTLGIDSVVELSDSQLEQWRTWFRRGYFLYVIFNSIVNGKRPDGGFTGGRQVLENFPGFIGGAEKVLDVSEEANKFIGQSGWGYFNQFWSGPMRYYHSIYNIEHCAVGIYAANAHLAMSHFPQWSLLISALKSGIIDRTTFDQLSPVLSCDSLSSSEEEVAQGMILDRESETSKAAEEYRGSYHQFCEFLHVESIESGDSNWQVAGDIVSRYIYRGLKSTEAISTHERKWRTFCLSYPFEAGLVKLFADLCGRTSGTLLDKTQINEIVSSDLTQWRSGLGIDEESSIEAYEAFMERALSSEAELSTIIDELVEGEKPGTWISGLFLGYAAYQRDRFEGTGPNWFQDMTQNYYYFVPQSFFKTFQFSTSNLQDDLEAFVYESLRAQYRFSLARMQMGQIAKFLTIPAEDLSAFEMKGLEGNIITQQGLLGLFASILSLWMSAGLIKIDSNGRLTGSSPEWMVAS